jgi:Skp family chaperone for outer membrane proteins
MCRRNWICLFVLTVLMAATAQADQTEEPGVQYGRDLTRVVNEVEQQHVESMTQRQLRELEKKLDELLKEMRQLRRELNRPSRQIEVDPPQRDANARRSETPEVERRYLIYSASVIKKYDENGDEVLVSDEWSRMSKDPSAADTNHDGRISAPELAMFYQQPRESSTKPSHEKQKEVDPRLVKYCEAVVKRYDKNGDGFLASDEWSDSQRDYSTADTDDDGLLSPKEMALHYYQQGVRVKSSPAARQPQADPRYLKYSTGFIKKYDQNDDGVLTEDEWSKLLVDYSDADTNHDGKITPTEMALLLMKRSGAGGL